MTTPALGSVRAAFPSSGIVLAANPVVSELMSPHPFCDRVVVYDKRGPHRGIRGLWKFCDRPQSSPTPAVLPPKNYGPCFRLPFELTLN